MNNKLIAPRLCLECREPFTPRKPSQRFCPRPARCWYQTMARQKKGKAPLAAIAKRRQLRGEAAAAAVEARFGQLSEREQDIYAAGYGQGYDAGYHVAYGPWRRGEVA